MLSPTPPLRVFQQLAQDVARRYAVLHVSTHVDTTCAHGPLYYCCYRLPGGQLPCSDGWGESAEAPTIYQALDFLREALRHHATRDFFSLN